MYCTQCGKEITETQICPHCGCKTEFAEQKMKISQGGERAAKTSFICAIVGLFIMGIPLGITAVISAIVALSSGYRGAKPIIGIILGIVDIAAVIVLMPYLTEIIQKLM